MVLNSPSSSINDKSSFVRERIPKDNIINKRNVSTNNEIKSLNNQKLTHWQL